MIHIYLVKATEDQLRLIDEIMEALEIKSFKVNQLLCASTNFGLTRRAKYVRLKIDVIYLTERGDHVTLFET